MALLDTVKALCKERNIAVSKLEDEAGLSRGTVGRWDASMPSIDKVQKVAAYFGVSTSELLGEDAKKAPTDNGGRQVSDEDIKFALFGGEGEITDAMFEEVKQFAAFVRKREQEKGK